MTQEYAKVVDGEVVEVTSKPKSKKTSNLWLNPEALKEEGWLPLDRKEPVEGQKVVKWEYEVLQTKVNKIPIQLEDNKPVVEDWQKANKTTIKELSDKHVQEYEVVDTPLADYKERKENNIVFHAQEQLFKVPFNDLDSWVKAQKKALDDATTHAEVAAISTTYGG